MKRGFRCKYTILEKLENEYNKLVREKFEGNYLTPLQKFDSIAENKLRCLLNSFYDNSRSLDQAWKTCKGSLYEFAVFKFIEQIISKDPNLKSRFKVVMGDETLALHREQIVIKNWCEILPDVDIIIVEKERDSVKVVISCKTSLRERLTETAFWKRELEKNENTRDIKLAFVTTDKDNELKIDTNRYILLHVIDCTFITDPQKYKNLIESYKKKYGNREDYNVLAEKVCSIEGMESFLKKL